jgi:hypothetical protein
LGGGGRFGLCVAGMGAGFAVIGSWHVASDVSSALSSEW